MLEYVGRGVMATPEQRAAGDRILATVDSWPGNHVYITTRDGLGVHVSLFKRVHQPFVYRITATVPVTTRNEDLGLTHTLFGHGFWERSCDCEDHEDYACYATIDAVFQGIPLIDSFICASSAEEASTKVFTMMQGISNIKACSCRGFFVLDNADVCFDCFVKTACDPTARASRGQCPICIETVTTDDQTECCQKPMHAACLSRAMGCTPTCPLCRAPGAKRRRPDAAE